MVQQQISEARFERVSPTGDLIFSVDGLHVSITVDEQLERAILEAKQLKEETRPNDEAPAATSLPISQIQSLIRAGASTAQVAQKYHISEVLVRRFSTSIQLEKQYAIKQFLTVSAPKNSHFHTLADMIERTLTIAGIGMETVTWRATRKGLEPWVITAMFDSAGQRIQAQWSWNMHDNVVNSLNTPAQILVSQQPTPHADTPTPLPAANTAPNSAIAGNASANAATPSMSAPLAATASGVNTPTTAQQTISSTGASMGIPAAQSGVTAMPNATSSSSVDAGANTAPQLRDDAQFNADGYHDRITPTAESQQVSATPTAVSPTPVLPISASPTSASATLAATTAEGNHATDTTKKRAGRSAVPSWDEILFGEER